MGKRIIISVTNDLSSDQRVHRVAETLRVAGMEVLLIGRQKRNSRVLNPRSYATHRMSMWFEKGKFFYLEHSFRLFWLLLFRKCDLLLANDMDTLLANFMVAKIRRKKLIYDSHEYWTEVPELLERRFTRSIWLRLERWLFPRVDAAYTVNDSLARIYREKYGLAVGTVRNLPLAGEQPVPRKGARRTLIYQGALNLGRGIGLMIAAMAELQGYTLWVVGSGDLDEPLYHLAQQSGLGEQVIFKGFVPFEELKVITAQADLGLSLEEDRGASYHYALPNKLFDYLQAGLPVLVADLPEMRNVVEKYVVGEILPGAARNAKDLALKIRNICEDEAYWEKLHQASIQAGAELCWENEQKRLLEIFEPFLL
ncbi:MAG TPA: glycosyltransferase [Bacteroidetes bacterium]|nr:glycosyltransferase [Bacteroidota bacterium]